MQQGLRGFLIVHPIYTLVIIIFFFLFAYVLWATMYIYTKKRKSIYFASSNYLNIKTTASYGAVDKAKTKSKLELIKAKLVNNKLVNKETSLAFMEKLTTGLLSLKASLNKIDMTKFISSIKLNNVIKPYKNHSVVNKDTDNDDIDIKSLDAPKFSKVDIDKSTIKRTKVNLSSILGDPINSFKKQIKTSTADKKYQDDDALLEIISTKEEIIEEKAKKLDFLYDKNTTSAYASENLKWSVIATAPYSQYYGHNIASASLPCDEELKEALDTDPYYALNHIERLRVGESRAYFQNRINLAANTDYSNLKSLLNSKNKTDAQLIKHVAKNIKEYVSTSMIAWDLAQAITLVRQVKSYGSLLNDEMADYMLDFLGAEVRHSYESWRDLAEGLELSAELSYICQDRDLNEINLNKEAFLKQENSPWQDIEYPKESWQEDNLAHILFTQDEYEVFLDEHVYRHVNNDLSNLETLWEYLYKNAHVEGVIKFYNTLKYGMYYLSYGPLRSVCQLLNFSQQKALGFSLTWLLYAPKDVKVLEADVDEALSNYAKLFLLNNGDDYQPLAELVTFAKSIEKATQFIFEKAADEQAIIFGKLITSEQTNEAKKYAIGTHERKLDWQDFPKLLSVLNS